MTDADVDGSHIRALLLTFFNNKPFNKLIENGNVYLAQPPLFKINKGTNSPRVKKHFFHIILLKRTILQNLHYRYHPSQYDNNNYQRVILHRLTHRPNHYYRVWHRIVLFLFY